MKKICLVIPTLSSGGMERVMSEIANHFAKKTEIEVHLILLIKKDRHFSIDEKVKIHEPEAYNSTSFFKILWYLRKLITTIKPTSVISFGSMFNSFVMISCFGLENKIKIYLSDRSNPYRNTYLTLKKGGDQRHDGLLHFLLKRIFYKRAHGILCQTKLSMDLERKSLKHKRLIYFPNPVRLNDNNTNKRDNVILNVGRFIASKQQSYLVEIFQNINNKNWKLVFLGDGDTLNHVKELVREDFKDNIIFEGNKKDVQSYLNRSKIFAFTSRSEGFPNSLAEALSTPIASISFDCVAGSSDLIINEVNGFLIPIDDIQDYTLKLKEMMESEELRDNFEKNALIEIQKFEREIVLDNLLTEILN